MLQGLVALLFSWLPSGLFLPITAVIGVAFLIIAVRILTIIFAMVAKEFFHNVWNLFLSVDVPGLGVSFAAFAIALFLIRFSIGLLSYITGFGMNGGDYGRAATTAEKYKNDRKKALDGKSSKFDW